MDSDFNDETRDLIDICNINDYKNNIVSSYYGKNTKHASVYYGDDFEEYIESVINRITLLDTDIWNAIEELECSNNQNVSVIADSLRKIYECTDDFDLEELVSLLKESEQIASSLNIKRTKLSRLNDLQLLNSMLQCNKNAISLIYNWDSIVRDIKEAFKNYSQFNERAIAESRTLLLSRENDIFNLNKLKDLKNVLASINRDIELCIHSVNQFENISNGLQDFMTQYNCILGQLCSEYINLINDGTDKLSEIPVSPKVILELYIFEIDLLGSVNRFMDEIKCNMIQIINDNFNKNWSSAFGDNEMFLLEFKNQDIVPVLKNQKSIFPNIINSYMEFIASIIAKFKNFLFDIFDYLAEYFPDLVNTWTVDKFLTELLSLAFSNFQCFDEIIMHASQDDINLVAIESFEAFELTLERLYAICEIDNIQVIFNRLSFIPKHLMMEYLMQLYNEANVSIEQPPMNDNFTNIAEGLNGYSMILNKLKNFKNLVDSKSCAHGCNVIFAIFVLNAIHRVYEQVSDHLLGVLQRHFLKSETISSFKSPTISTHKVYKEFLLELHKINMCLLDEAGDAIRHIGTMSTTTSTIMQNSIGVICKDDSFIRELNPTLSMMLKGDTYKDYLQEIFTGGNNIILSYVTILSNAIKKTACGYMSDYHSISPRSANTSLAKNDNFVAYPIEMIGEYFTCLLPIYGDVKTSEFRIIQEGFNKFIDEELERLAGIQNLQSQYHRMNLMHLIKIGNVCNAQATESLEMLLQG
ncbi:hypothetical protein BdWA1_002316 [Babesia duncani]|uniref:Uncharacterized protein n=1 Tax=Babesia duncani TaxID=323732 RepID=A0AAD9PJ12_9APIC|nr:hypothetical protein BdWA1_002316 [Babesia duncani]